MFFFMFSQIKRVFLHFENRIIHDYNILDNGKKCIADGESRVSA